MDGSKPSKFRHTFGSVRSKSGYEAVKPRSTRDGSLIKANSSIVAVQWATSGFGALVVLPTRDGDKSGKGGRLTNPPMIEAHKSSLQDFDISPFNDRLIVTSDGGALKLWQVPEEGLKETMREATDEVKGEAVKRLSQLNFHPTSENLLSTFGKDFALRLFDVTKGSPVVAFKEGHSDLILSASWSLSGSLVATGCKDKILRICDPRGNKVVHQTEAHPGVKGFVATWLGARDQIVTAGFSKNGERQLSIWDLRSFSTALHSSPIDTSPGMITPYYDAATEMVFLLGRGDSTIRYYEVNDDEPYIHYLDQFRGTDSQADITPFAKRIVDYGSCEVARFAKLTKDKIEHLMFQVPRKDSKDSLIFHEDLYKCVPSAKPSTNAQDWISGATKDTTFLTLQEMMPSGYRSIYEIDSMKKAEDEKREQEKKAYQSMTLEERTSAKENVAKKGDASSSSQAVGEDSDDDSDDQATLAKFSHSRANSGSADGPTTTPPPTVAKVASPVPVTPTPTKASSAASTPPVPTAPSPRQGHHKTNLDDGSVYEGEYKNDQKHGRGTLTLKADGSSYDGAWADDKRAGAGVLKLSSVTANGSWIDNKLDTSSAIFSLADGSVFEFAVFDDSGKVTAGKLKYKDGETYEGAFNSSGKRNGVGVWTSKDGGKYEGEYKDDLRHGKGEYHYPDGGVYAGGWKADLPDGDGVFHDKSGKIITGTWSKGKLTKYTLG